MIDRRTFVAGCATSVAALALANPAKAQTLKIPAKTAKKCATCNFWGGTRQLSSDGRFVLASGTGLCQNPKSPAYKKQTKPDQGAPVWTRWEAIT